MSHKINLFVVFAVLTFISPSLTYAELSCLIIRALGLTATDTLGAWEHLSTFDHVVYRNFKERYEANEKLPKAASGPEEFLAVASLLINRGRTDQRILEIDRLFDAQPKYLSDQELKMRERLITFASKATHYKRFKFSWGWPPVFMEKSSDLSYRSLLDFFELATELNLIASLDRQRHTEMMKQYDAQLITFRYQKKLIDDLASDNVRLGLANLGWSPSWVQTLFDRHANKINGGAAIAIQAGFMGLMHHLGGVNWMSLIPGYLPKLSFVKNLGIQEKFQKIYSEKGLDSAIEFVYDTIQAKTGENLKATSEERLLLAQSCWSIIRKIHAASLAAITFFVVSDSFTSLQRIREFKQVTNSQKADVQGHMSTEDIRELLKSRNYQGLVAFAGEPDQSAYDLAQKLITQMPQKNAQQIIDENRLQINDLGALNNANRLFIITFLKQYHVNNFVLNDNMLRVDYGVPN